MKQARVSDAAIKAARQRAASPVDFRIEHAAYDVANENLVVKLTTGGMLTLPKGQMPKIIRAVPSKRLSEIEVEPSGQALWFPVADEGITLSTIVEALIPAPWFRSRAAQMAGSVVTEAKAAASRANGASGGRPKKSPSGFYETIGSKRAPDKTLSLGAHSMKTLPPKQRRRKNSGNYNPISA